MSVLTYSAPDTAPARRGRHAEVEFRILGVLEVVERGRRLPLGGARLRALLATLLVHAGEVRTADQFVDDLWGECPPASACSSLQNMVATLRQTLRLDLLTMNAGYVLSIDAEQLDASRFERLLEDSASGDPRAKVRMLTRALSLWRGSPLVDVR